MSEDAPGERNYGVGEDIRGKPGPFPFGLVSNAFATVAVLTMLLTMVSESSSWFPFELWGYPGPYWPAVLASLVTGTIALKRKPWRGMRSVGWILVWLCVLSPIFPAAIVLLFLARH